MLLTRKLKSRPYKALAKRSLWWLDISTVWRLVMTSPEAEGKQLVTFDIIFYSQRLVYMFISVFQMLVTTMYKYILRTSAWSGPARTGTQYRHFYILAFKVPVLFCAYRHFWHVAGSQSKIVRVWVIRLYDPIYDYKLYRNYVKHTTQAGAPLISNHHVNERKQSRSTSLCGAREGETCQGRLAKL